MNLRGLTVLLLLVGAIRCSLLYVVELARHGARFPINPYYDYRETIGDAGELSPTGMRQHYNLGRYLRRMYMETETFLSVNYDHREIEVWSTQYKRTIESASAQMMGLFPAGTGPTIPDGVQADRLLPPFTSNSNLEAEDFGLPGGLQTVPILDGEYYLENCDSYMEWEELMIAENFQDYSNVTLYYAPFIEKLRKLFNLTLEESNLVGLSRLYDTLYCDRYLGRAVPISNEEMDNLRHLHNYLYMLIHSGTYRRIIGTPLFTKILADLDSKVANVTSPKKMTVFLGHDTNISPVLSYLNFSSFLCIEDAWQKKPLDGYLNCEDGPGFASNVLFELRTDNSTAEPYVKVLYNGKEMNLCGRKQTNCPYS